MIKKLTFTLFTLCFFIGTDAQTISSSIWRSTDINKSLVSSDRTWIPSKYMTVSTDVDFLRKSLSSLPMERTDAVAKSNYSIELPSPDGQFLKFKIWQTNVMHPDLAKNYPMIRTFAGTGLTDKNSKVFFDYTQFGFHALVMTSNGWYYIEPFDLNTSENYLVYYRKDIGHGPSFDCGVESETNMKSLEDLLSEGNGNNSTSSSVGNTLRDYRLALACTGEYASYYGGTVSGALAGMVTSINRVDGIYETEMCISLTLIPNDTLIIYTNASTDPYTNNNGGSMLGQNQTTITNVIGSANYDIGHVFSTGGGGIANLGCVCSSSNKARGVTGSPSPVGDGFDVDYVAHEMGHQFGANHTFNSSSGACSGNRNASTAYEPGSGITIMGYAGICGSDDLAAHSIAYFHLISLAEINVFTTTGGGASCPVSTPTGNNAPITTTSGAWIIPYQTPFRLTASGSDPDGDPLFYTWEEYDKGPSTTWNNPSGDAPIYRSYAPDTSATRIFPKLNYVLANTTGKGELKPSYARTLKFKCTLRDQKSGGGGWVYNVTNVTVQCINTGTGFAITYPNLTGITWAQGSQETVTWNVAQSDVAPINTPTVNILLSTNGGNNFTTVLASGVPNNGSAVITVPTGISSSTCRIMVEGAGNVFFDINDKNFAISPASISESVLNKSITVFPNPVDDLLSITIADNIKGEVNLVLYDQTGRIVLSQTINPELNGNDFKLELKNIAKGIYTIHFENEGAVVNQKIVKN